MKLWYLATALTCAWLAIAPPSQAAPETQITPAVGGGGGGQLAVYCDNNRWLTGLEVRYGNWIDAVGLACGTLIGSDGSRTLLPAPPNASAVFEGEGGARGVGASSIWGGNGGARGAIRCQADEVISGLHIEPSPNNFVGRIGLRCKSLNTWKMRPGPFIGRTSLKSPPSKIVDCPSGMLAIGFHGATGDFVDRLGLVCTPFKPVDEPIAAGMEDNTDRSGRDYNRTRLSLRAPDRCQAACAADKRCKAWTYVRPGIQDERAVCYLKDAVPPASKNGCCISGVKQTPFDPKVIVTREPGPFGAAPRRCKSGFVWREAKAADVICVTPESRAMAAQENQVAASRRDPNGAYGPDTCIAGFVWREAFDGDTVCVTPERRAAVKQENQLAPGRTEQ